MCAYALDQINRPARLDILGLVSGDTDTLRGCGCVWETGGDRRLQGKVLGSIFFEPSTRTASSFQAAFQVRVYTCIWSVSRMIGIARAGNVWCGWPSASWRLVGVDRR